VVAARGDDVTVKSLRNAPQVHLLTPDQLNTYDVLCADDVVFTGTALEAFLARSTADAAAEATNESDVETTEEVAE
jgi:large subunit ribosomal protein L4